MKIVFLSIFLCFVQYAVALTVYTDTPYIRPFLNKTLPSVKYTDNSEKAELGLVNGLRHSVIRANMHDYTIGIEDINLEDGKVNDNVIYSFDNYKKILHNITDVLSLHYPHEEKKFHEILKKTFQEIDAIKQSVKCKKKMIFRYGNRFDYLLKEFQQPFIPVDGSFTAREKAFREYNISLIFVCEPMPETIKKSIDALLAGYVYYDVSVYDQITDLPIQLKTVLEAFSR